jgi:putative SOS response-associated peptidase YedK
MGNIMCYYNSQKVKNTAFVQLGGQKKAVKDYDFLDVGVHNGFTYPPSAIAIATDDKRDFDIVKAQWGYVPGVMSEAEANAFRRKLTTLNFKGENLWVSEHGGRSMWTSAARDHRCLVLSTGIIESRHIPKIGKKGQELKEKIKYPYQVTVKDHPYFWLPGIYNDWLNPDTGEKRRTFACGITKANGTMKQVHNSKLRMPAILPDPLAWEWLTGDLTDDRITEIAMTQIPSKMLDICTIDPNYRTSGEVTPKDYPELPAIDMTYVDQESLHFNHWVA